MSQSICHDPLEKFFGRQRQRGATNENPNVSQFLKNNQALRVVNSIRIETSKENTRRLQPSQGIPITTQPLPKCRRPNQSTQTSETKQTIQLCTSHGIEGEVIINFVKFITNFVKFITLYIFYIVDTLKLVIKDTGFQLPTQEASNALKTAETLLTWCS